VVLAALVVAWCAASYRAVGVEEDANALVSRAAFEDVSRAEMERAREDLQSASRFNADGTARILEGALLFASDRTVEAAAVARRATAEEPDNVEAWLLTYAVAPDGAAKQEAKREVRRLNPWAADAPP
jgi:hypothetical protein